MQTYRTDDARLYVSTLLAHRAATAFWVASLTYNAALQANQSYYRAATRQRELGNILPLRQSRSDLQRGISEYRSGDADYARVPVTTARLAVDEATIAVSNCINRWAAGESGAYPRFRHALGRQQARFIQFHNVVINDGTLHVSVMGLGRLKMRLHRSPPEDGRLREIRLSREQGRHGVQLVWEHTAIPPAIDPVATGLVLHAALRHLPPDATPGAILDAVAGLPVVGADLGLTNPLVDSAGQQTARVFVPKAEALARKELQRSIARKTNMQSKRRSKAKQRLQRLSAKHARRARTRALQDARWLTGGRTLISTEPNDMARRLMGQVADGKYAPDGKVARMLRRRMHETGWSKRLRRIQHVSQQIGIIYIEAPYRGSSQECSGCGIPVPKKLWQRKHLCSACGLALGRDHNAAGNLLSRALRPFINEADPEGRLARQASKWVDMVAADTAKRANRAERARASWMKRRIAAQSEAVVGLGRHDVPAEHQRERTSI